MNLQDFLLTEQSVEELSNKLTSIGYPEIKLISGKTVAVLTNKNRMEVMKDLEQRLPGKYIPKPLSVSSIGYIDFDNFKILVKPSKRQGRMSAGVENEDMIVNSLNELIKTVDEPLIIRFIGHNTNFDVKNVLKVEAVGTSTSGRKKADILLHTKSGKTIPISIKKDSADAWESADSYWSTNAKNYIDKYLKKKEIKLIKKLGIYHLEPNFVVPATEEEKIQVIFGSDLLGNGAVIIKTFSPDDFKLEGNVLKVYVTYVIKSLKDVPDIKDVFFLVRNDKTRNTKGFYPGLRILAVTKNRINKTVKVFPRD